MLWPVFTRIPNLPQAGIGQVGEQPAAPPGLSDGQMPTIMLPGGAAMVAHWGTAADGEDLMHLNRRLVPGPGKLLTQGVADPDRRGIDDVPVWHAIQRTR
jgi:hypothetical protein